MPTKVGFKSAPQQLVLDERGRVESISNHDGSEKVLLGAVASGVTGFTTDPNSLASHSAEHRAMATSGTLITDAELSAQLAGLGVGTIRIPLVVNDPSAASANTVALQAFSNSLSNSSTSRLNVVFPDGDVYYNGTIVWRSYQNQNIPIVVTPEAEWPAFGSAGTTTFRYVGPQIDGASWTFRQGTPGTQATNLKFSNIRFVGPGVSVITTAVATSAVGSSAASVVVSSAEGVNVGNAICISADALAGGSPQSTSLPWWATITSVVGQTVSFAPATPGSGFGAAIGNVVQIFRQGKAIQIGGVDPTIQDVNFYVVFDKCAFVDWFTGIAVNDVTSMDVTGETVFQRVMYGAEYGYNIDSTRWTRPAILNQISSIGGAVTSGSYVITGLSGTNQLRVGMSMGDITAPASAQSFPEWACIKSIDSASQVTMTHPSSVSGTRTFQPAMGWLIAIGSGGSPFYPRASVGDGSRANADATVIQQPLLNHAKGIYLCDSNDNSSVVVEDIYAELCQRLAIIGNQYGVSSTGPYIFRRGILSGAAAFTGTPIESLGGGVNMEVSDINSAGPIAFPFIGNRISSNPVSLKYTRNNVSTTASGLIKPNIYYFQGISPSAGADALIDLKRPASANIIAEVIASGATTNQEVDGWDGVNIMLNASTTLANQPTGTPMAGKKYRIVVSSSGAYTLALGSNYVDQAGAAIASRIAASSSGKTCIMDFIGSGTKYVLVGGSLSTGLPVFI